MRTRSNMVWMYASLLCTFKTNDCTLSRHVYLVQTSSRQTLPKLSGYTLSTHTRQTQLAVRCLRKLDKNKSAMRFRSKHTRSKAAVHFLDIYGLILNCAAMSFYKHHQRCRWHSFGSSKRLASVLSFWQSTWLKQEIAACPPNNQNYWSIT